jgi:hypothetical protein
MLGQYHKAKQLHETTLNIRKRMLGNEHVAILYSEQELYNCQFVLDSAQRPQAGGR